MVASGGDPNACIELTHVSKSYGSVPALSDLSFEIPVGGRFALLGPNGAGKSTTLKLLIGSLKPDTGYIKILGSFPDSKESKSAVGYLPRTPSHTGCSRSGRTSPSTPPWEGWPSC